MGDWLDISLIPSTLGVNFPERIQKWLAYKKGGLGLIDTAQEGRAAAGLAPMNTLFSGFDDTIKTLAVLAILIAIDSIEQTVSSITGVFRERLLGIEQRDAVTNIKQGVLNSFIVTKLYYQQMDLITGEILLDALNEAKVVFKNGLTGTIILGEKYLRIFTALPEYFTLSDFDIHITTSSDVVRGLEQIKAIVPEFVRSGAVAPDIIFDIIDSKSLSDAKIKVKSAMLKQKEENNQIQLLTQQAEQLQQQLQEAQSLLKKALLKIQELNEQKLNIEKYKIDKESRLQLIKLRNDAEWHSRDMDNDEKRVQIELLQLRDGNPYNDLVKY